MAEPNPLQRYLATQVILDKELSRILRDAADEGERLMAKTLGKGIGDKVERAQLAIAVRELRKQQAELWGSVTKATEAAMARAAMQAAEAENLLNRVLFNALGGPIPELERAMHLRSQEAVKNYIARTENGIPLSAQVYDSKALSNGWVEREINRGVLLGRSAAQIADSVRKFISPDVPGGVSYAAQRLGRTELNNAFHRAQINQRENSPWTTGMKWNLSGSHPKPDACNDYADSEHFKGGGAGVFRVGDVPGKPHPNCLCYLTSVQIDEEEFIQRFAKGQYNTYIDQQINRYAPNVSPC